MVAGEPYTATPRSSGPQRDAVGSEIARTIIETRVRGIVQGVGFRSFVYRTDGGSHPSVLCMASEAIPDPNANDEGVQVQFIDLNTSDGHVRVYPEVPEVQAQ